MRFENANNENSADEIEVPTNSNKNIYIKIFDLTYYIGRVMYILARVFFVLAGLSLVILNGIYGFVLPHTNVDCIIDLSFNATAGINDYFAKEVESKKTLLIFSSLACDLVAILIGVLWIMKGNSYRMVITLGIFYIFKFAMEFLFQERTPDGNLWEYPGFPSLMVGYLKTDTYFYSTVMGFLLVAALESYKLDNTYLCVFAIITLIFEMFTRIVLRGNYSIDIISSLILAHFIYIFANEWCPKYIDKSNNVWFNLSNDEDAQSSDVNNKSISTNNDALLGDNKSIGDLNKNI